MSNLAFLEHARGRSAEAEKLWRETLEVRRQTLSEDHADTLVSTFNLGAFLMETGRFQEAEQLILVAFERASGDLRRRSAARLVRLYEAWGKPEKAAEWRDRR